MKLGTRVHHRRYTWMVGTVVLLPMRDYAVVRWDTDYRPYSSAVTEPIEDLRQTPTQPAGSEG